MLPISAKIFLTCVVFIGTAVYIVNHRELSSYGWLEIPFGLLGILSVPVGLVSVLFWIWGA